MSSKQISIRMGPKTATAAERASKRAGVPLATWVLERIQEHLGVTESRPTGFASMTPARRREVAVSGARTRYGKE